MDDETAVRAARTRYNDAIAARDPVAITNGLTRDYALVASTGVAVTGRDALLNHWSVKFKQDANVLYVREPAAIAIDGDRAHERGSWSGHWTRAGARIEGRGDYVAEWRREKDGKWRVASESFTPRD